MEELNTWSMTCGWFLTRRTSAGWLLRCSHSVHATQSKPTSSAMHCVCGNFSREKFPSLISSQVSHAAVRFLWGNPLVAQWPGVCAFTAEGPTWRIKIPQAAGCSQGKKKKKGFSGLQSSLHFHKLKKHCSPKMTVLDGLPRWEVKKKSQGICPIQKT